MKGENLLERLEQTAKDIEETSKYPICIAMSEETFKWLKLSMGEPRIGHTPVVFKNFLKFGTAYICRLPDMMILD